MNEKINQLLAAAVDFDVLEAEYFPNDAVAAEGDVVQGDFRPVVYLPGPSTDPRDFADKLGGLLKDKGLYLRAGAVWRHDVVQGKLVLMSPTQFVYWCLDHVKMLVQGGKAVELARLSGEHAAQLLQAPQFLNHLPEIQRVSEVPMPVWVNGKLRLLEQGYNAEHKTLVIAGVDFDRDLSAEDACALWMDKWVGEFRFEEGNRSISQSILLAAMLAPWCELLVPAFAQRPCFIFSANRPGAGKTLAARLCLVPIHGKTEITPPPDTRGEELTKTLAAVARAGKPYILFDNWKGKIENSALEAFITSNIYSGRVLGASELFSAEKSCLVYITGNDAKVSPDMRRRSLIVEFSIEEARAEDRKIKREMDEDVILEGRGELLGILWAMLKHWDAAGRPDSSVSNGTFAKWGKTIGGIVETLGLPSPMTPVSLARAGDDDGEAMAKLVLEVMGDETRKELSSRELMEVARGMGLFSFLAELGTNDQGELVDGRSDKEKRVENAIWGKVLHRFASETTKTKFSNGVTMGMTAHLGRPNRRIVLHRNAS